MNNNLSSTVHVPKEYMAPLYCQLYPYHRHPDGSRVEIWYIQICKFNYMHEYVNCGYQLLELQLLRSVVIIALLTHCMVICTDIMRKKEALWEAVDYYNHRM